MSQTMGARVCICLFCFFCVAAHASGSDLAVDKALAGLEQDSAEARIASLRALMTSLDPRIPDALLPLLGDEGNSIRRLAARAIGSRWWQIPERDRPKFVRALKQNLGGDESEMARRAIALLSRNYKSSGVVFPSPKGRWVVYERRKLPCIIDTLNGNEELVGWEPEPTGELKLFSAVWGEREKGNRQAALWHPDGDMVALDVTIWKRESAVWVWRPGSRLHRVEPDEVLALLAPHEKEIFRLAGVTIEPVEWNGDTLVLEVNYSTGQDGMLDKVATLRWNSDTDTLSLSGIRKAEY